MRTSWFLVTAALAALITSMLLLVVAHRNVSVEATRSYVAVRTAQADAIAAEVGMGELVGNSRIVLEGQAGTVEFDTSPDTPLPWDHQHHREDHGHGPMTCNRCASDGRLTLVGPRREDGRVLLISHDAASIGNALAARGAWLDQEPDAPQAGVARAQVPGAPEGWAVALSANDAAALAGVNRALYALVGGGLLSLLLVSGLLALAGFLAASRQRTARKLADERALMASQAAHSDRLAILGTLTAGVAHDMRGPLSVYSMCLPSLKTSDERMHAEIVDDMRLATASLLSLATDLTAFSRANGADKTCDPAVAVRLAERLWRPSVQQLAGFELIVEDGLPAVGISERKLSQVLVNLVLNASHVANRVTVHSVPSADGVRLVVEDDGPGVPTALRDQLFEPFYTTKPEGEGTGLGLFLCRRMVEEAGGTIEVSDAALGGARFDILLPRHASA